LLASGRFKSKNNDDEGDEKKKKVAASATSSHTTTMTSLDVTSSAKDISATVVVCAAEISKCPEVISLLKHRHNCQVMMLRGNCVGASFMVSARMSVERLTAQEFCNANHRQQVLRKCQDINATYSRPYLIVEEESGAVSSDCHNVNEPAVVSSSGLMGCGGGVQPRTKYVDWMLAQLSETNIKVLFSQSQANTAHLIAALLKREKGKNFGLPSPAFSTDTKNVRQLLQFYRSCLPVGGQLGVALQLVAGYKTPLDFARSARATLIRKTNLSEAQAAQVQSYLNKDFKPVIPYAN